MRKTLRTSVAFAAAAFAATAMAGALAPASAEMLNYTIALEPEHQVPPVNSPGGGLASFTYDTATKVLTWNITFSALTGPATAAHIHGPAEPDTNAGVLLPFASAASPITGSATLTEAQAAHLLAGKLYVNVHTAAHPNGEIRGTIDD